eukprot:167095-Prymnesium_polylepis.1
MVLSPGAKEIQGQAGAAQHAGVNCRRRHHQERGAAPAIHPLARRGWHPDVLAAAHAPRGHRGGCCLGQGTHHPHTRDH